MYDTCLDMKKNHQFARKEVKRVRCLRCKHEQPKAKACEKCKVDFAVYYCEVCALYDDKGLEKKIFHCDKCGICRVGGRENTYHCDVCDCCLNIAMKDNHKCVPARFKQDCPVCMEDMSTSRMAGMILRCGHAMHAKCF
jgi:RING finger and CHY zinc finger domain-containing protein 1